MDADAPSVSIRVPLMVKAQHQVVSVSTSFIQGCRASLRPFWNNNSEDSIALHIVTDDDKFFRAVRVTEGREPKGTPGPEEKALQSLLAIAKRIDTLFSCSKQKVQPPVSPQSWLQIVQCSSVPEDVYGATHNKPRVDNVVLYQKKDYVELMQVVAKAGATGAFIVCVDDEKDIPAVTKLFSDFSSVEVVSRELCVSEDFAYFLLNAILKRALREVGFME